MSEVEYFAVKTFTKEYANSFVKYHHANVTSYFTYLWIHHSKRPLIPLLQPLSTKVTSKFHIKAPSPEPMKTLQFPCNPLPSSTFTTLPHTPSRIFNFPPTFTSFPHTSQQQESFNFHTSNISSFAPPHVTPSPPDTWDSENSWQFLIWRWQWRWWLGHSYWTASFQIYGKFCIWH